MAEQPYYRPYEHTTFYADGRSARPLELGVISRTQGLEDSPLMTGLTTEEWADYRKREEEARRNPAKAAVSEPKALLGAPRADPRAENAPRIFVDAFPFDIETKDIRRGMERYTIFCVECHGTLGNGGGKIVERGFLRPPSFQTIKLENEPDESAPTPAEGGTQLPFGYSRGFNRFGVRIPLREVPVGYIFEVISKGYGGMPDYASQVPPADRWRIAAYVRTLQLSQSIPAESLPPADRDRLKGDKK